MCTYNNIKQIYYIRNKLIYYIKKKKIQYRKMSHNTNKYIKTKFKVFFGTMKSPTMYAELHNGKYTKTYQNEKNEIVSDYITLEEYASALAHIMLRENGSDYFKNKDVDNNIPPIQN